MRKAHLRRLAAITHACGGSVVRKWRLDIETNPINFRQQGAQPIRINAGSVQTDLEAALPYLLNRWRKVAIHRRLAAAKNNSVKQPLPSVKKIEHRLPRGGGWVTT